MKLFFLRYKVCLPNKIFESSGLYRLTHFKSIVVFRVIKTWHLQFKKVHKQQNPQKSNNFLFIIFFIFMFIVFCDLRNSEH